MLERIEKGKDREMNINQARIDQLIGTGEELLADSPLTLVEIPEQEEKEPLFNLDEAMAELGALKSRIRDLKAEPAVGAYLDSVAEEGEMEETIKSFIRATGVSSVAVNGLEAVAVPKSKTIWDAAGLSKKYPWLVGAGVIIQTVDGKAIEAQLKAKTLPSSIREQYSKPEPMTTQVTIRVQKQ